MREPLEEETQPGYHHHTADQHARIHGAREAELPDDKASGEHDSGECEQWQHDRDKPVGTRGVPKATPRWATKVPSRSGSTGRPRGATLVKHVETPGMLWHMAPW